MMEKNRMNSLFEINSIQNIALVNEESIVPVRNAE